MIAGICLLSFSFCENPPKTNSVKEDTAKSSADTSSDYVETPDIQFSEAQLLVFLDSIGQLDSKNLEPKSVSAIDSVFRNRKQLKIDLAKEDFKKLQESAGTGRINLSLAKRIFPFKIDSTFIADQEVLIEFFPLSTPNPFREFIISIGERRAAWGNDLYFFKGNTIISWHPNFCKNNNEIFHFKDSDGNTVVYYTENFGGGSGIWQYNYFFYKYMDTELVPVLNVLQDGNFNFCGMDNRHYRLESSVLKTKPLFIKCVYDYALNDYHSNFIEIIRDSTEITYNWDKSAQSFRANPNNKLTPSEIYSYYPERTDLYHINLEYAVYKSLLSSNRAKREAILVYLNKVKNDLAKGYYKE